MPDHIPIIKWAAGAPVALPDDVDFNTNTLIDLVDAHNLSGQFLSRIRNNNPKWVTYDLVEGLNDLFFMTTTQVARNISAFTQLRQQLKFKKTNIIVIKGISTYVLSDESEIMHAGDIDLLSDNTNNVVQTLLDTGYRQTRTPFMHEIGEFTKDSTEFDVHDYFPVYGYSKTLLESDLSPLHQNEEWQQQGYSFPHNKITFFDMFKSANHGTRPETEPIVVPDANMLAMIISAHAFMNYTNIWSISHREKACVRLGEIIDLFALARHASFNPNRFISYVDYFNAHDAVEWAASTAVSVFGKNPLPISVSNNLGQPVSATRFPRCLWWNFWASLSSEPDELLKTKWLSMEWLIQRIGANHIPVSQESEKSYSTVNSDFYSPLRRYITQQPEPIPLVIQIRRSEKGLILNLQISSSFEFDTERIRFDLGSIACEWIYDVGRNCTKTVGYPMDLSFRCNASGYEIIAKLDLEEIVLPMKIVGLCIGVMRQAGLNVLESILIPLELEF